MKKQWKKRLVFAATFALLGLGTLSPNQHALAEDVSSTTVSTPGSVEENPSSTNTNTEPMSGRQVSVSNFEELKQALLQAQDKDVIVLGAGEYPVSEKLVVTGQKSITLKADKGEAALIRTDAYKDTMMAVEQGASLTLSQNVTFDGKSIQNTAKDKQGGILHVTQASLVINGSVIQNDKRSNAYSMKQAPIVVTGEKATIVMNSGVIQNNDYSGDNSAYGAGAVYLSDGATMEMNGGTITGNQASNYETGVFSKKLVSDNQGAGAINVSENATLTMKGGELSNNKGWSTVVVGNNDPFKYSRTTTDESQLKPVGQAKATFLGGKITKNQGFYGGGIYGGLTYDILIPQGSTLEVSDNKARQGGGILVTDGMVDGDFVDSAKVIAKLSPEVWAKHYPASFKMEGGSVTGNYALVSGGGINVSSNCAEISGGTISNNRADDQGGGIYVTSVPYVLNVKNAYLSGNKTAANYLNIKSDGIWLYQNTGGAIWLCPTGDGEFYAKDGVFIAENNTAKREADGLFSSKKSGDYAVTLSNRAINGARVEYLTDSKAVRDGNEESKPIVVDHERGDVAVKSSLQDAADEAVIRSLSSLHIENNTASFGGGIGSNGSIVFGDPDGKTFDVQLKKAWNQAFTEEEKVPVTVELRAKMEVTEGTETTTKDWLIERVTLSKENNWQTTIRDLPQTVAGKSLKDMLYVKESGSTYEVSVSELTPVAEKTISFDLVRTNRMMDENVQAAYYDVPGTQDEQGDWKDFEVTFNIKNYSDDQLLASQKMTYDAKTAHWKNNRLHFENIPVTYSAIQAVESEPNNGLYYGNGELTYDVNIYPSDEGQTTYLLYPKVKSNTTNPIFTVENLKVHGPEDASTPTYTVTVTNHKKATIDIPVEKRWVDNGQKRPESIRVDLKANGKVVESKTVTKADEWKTVFKNLPLKNEAGKDITYTVEEGAVTGYATQVTGNVTNGFVITNTGEIPPTTETTTTTTEVPPTTQEKTTTTTEVPPTTEEKTTTTEVPTTTEEKTTTSNEVPTTGEVPPTTQTPPNKELPPTGSSSLLIPSAAALVILISAFGLLVSVKWLRP